MSRKRYRKSDEDRNTERPAKQERKGRVFVNRARYEAGELLDESREEEEIPVQVFETDPAYVKVSGGMTKNMGNYNNLKISVDVSVPCYPEGSEIDRAYDFASTIVDNKLRDELGYALGRHEEAEEIDA